ncbi:MAG: restriction endonuclease subunit S [Chloroflexi bacterium]|nr:restriction endonuclease subunit S [Chloroflexota bacterium]
MSQQSLPDGWNWIKLPQAVEIVMGQSPPSSSYNREGRGLPFFQGKADFGELYPTTQQWCTEPSKIAEANDVLLSVRAPVGPTNLARETCCIGRGLAALRTKPRLNHLYLLNYFRWIEPGLSVQGQGSTFQAITKDQLENMDIPLPPLPTQRAIVTILDKADTLRRKQAEALNLADRILPALFVDMFGDPATNRKKWEVAYLGDVVKSVGGGTPSKNSDDFWHGDIPWVSPKDMKSDEIWDTIDHITEDAIQESATNLIEPGHVLIVVRSGVLKHSFPIGINRVQVSINQDMKALSSPELTPEYLFSILKHLEKHIVSQSIRVGSTVHNIDSAKFFNIQIPLPPLALQQSFSNISFSYRNNQKRIVQSASESNILFFSLLNRAFTGELTAEWEAIYTAEIAAEVAWLERRPRLALLALVSQRQQRRPEPVGVTSLMKYAFLAQMQGQSLSQPTQRLFNFVPYHFGPFAKDLYPDLEALEAEGWLMVERATEDDPDAPERVDIQLSPARAAEVESALAELSAAERTDLSAIIEQYGDLSHNELLDAVYEQYPAYARKSRRHSHK